MSQKPRDDQHTVIAAKSAPVEAAAETTPWVSPIVMVTSTNDGVYITDSRLTKWEKLEQPTNG